MVIIVSKNKTYKLFTIEDVFYLFTGALIPKQEIKSGDIPRITATSNNNGIALFTNEINNKNYRVFDNFISISFLGDVFYQKNKVSLDMKIHGIKPKTKELNKYIAQFLIPLLRNFSLKYNYGNQLSMRLLKRQKINLPITFDEKPDWEYMAKEGNKFYQIQNKYIKEYLLNKKYKLEEDLANGNNINTNINDIRWGLYEIKDLFDTKRVSGTPLEKYSEGKLPFVSTSSEKNGVQGFVRSISNDISPTKSLTVSPIDGTVFYQPNQFVGRGGAGSSITSMNNDKVNKYSGLFLKVMIENSSKTKASYGVQLNGERLKATKFNIPVTKDNKPDWEYMENYMKKIEYEKTVKLIKYLS